MGTAFEIHWRFHKPGSLRIEKSKAILRWDRSAHLYDRFSERSSQRDSHWGMTTVCIQTRGLRNEIGSKGDQPTRGLFWQRYKVQELVTIANTSP